MTLLLFLSGVFSGLAIALTTLVLHTLRERDAADRRRKAEAWQILNSKPQKQ